MRANYKDVAWKRASNIAEGRGPVRIRTTKGTPHPTLISGVIVQNAMEKQDTVFFVHNDYQLNEFEVVKSYVEKVIRTVSRLMDQDNFAILGPLDWLKLGGVFVPNETNSHATINITL